MIVEGHFAPLGSDNSMHFMSFGENLMGRLVTNWIGGDGWMLKFDASHRVLAERINLSSVLVQKEILGGHGVGGDTVVGRAEVVNKFVDDGNHFVDLVT